MLCYKPKQKRYRLLRWLSPHPPKPATVYHSTFDHDLPKLFILKNDDSLKCLKIP